MNTIARPRAILKWLAVTTRRSRGSFSFRGNNLHYTGVALMFMLDPAGGILLLLMALIVILPLSSDPLRAIPRSRLNAWPLEDGERRLLRIVSPWLNPVTWVIVALALWRRVSWGVVTLAAGVVATGFLTSARATGGGQSPWRRLPRFPAPLNQMIRKDLRQMLSTLDFCCGGLIAVAALGWRAAGLLPAAAFYPMTMIAMLAISTCALTLFGLEGTAGMTRYRLMPARGWQILIAKDAAFIMMALIVAAPLSVPGAFGAALVALALGHGSSVHSLRAQTRWRFQAGPSLGDALVQIVAMTMAGAAVVYSSPAILFICIALWAISTWWFAREIDRRLLQAG